MEWISVKDRLPEDDATYLVYGRNWYGIVLADYDYYGDDQKSSRKLEKERRKSPGVIRGIFLVYPFPPMNTIAFDQLE